MGETVKGRGACDTGVQRRAVHIAAVVMQAAGLCRYENAGDCKKVWPPTDDDCVKCIERWLLAKARSEIKASGNRGRSVT